MKRIIFKIKSNFRGSVPGSYFIENLSVHRNGLWHKLYLLQNGLTARTQPVSILIVTVINSVMFCLLVKPAKTKCSVEGSQEIGKDVTLKCVSQEGSPLLSYDWKRVSGTHELPATSVLSTVKLHLLL